MITGGDLRQSRLDVGYKTFTISPWSYPLQEHPLLDSRLLTVQPLSEASLQRRRLSRSRHHTDSIRHKNESIPDATNSNAMVLFSC